MERRLLCFKMHGWHRYPGTLLLAASLVTGCPEPASSPLNDAAQELGVLSDAGETTTIDPAPELPDADLGGDNPDIRPLPDADASSTTDEGGGTDTGPADNGTTDTGPPPALDCPVSGAVVDSWGNAPAMEDATTIACLEVTNDRAARNKEVAFSGVPVAQSFGLLDTSRLAVLGSEGAWVPAQFEVLARWGGPLGDTSRPIRWLEVALSTDIGNDATHRYALVDTGAAQSPPDSSLVVSEAGGIYTLDTGAATFTVDSAAPGLLTSATIDAAALMAAPASPQVRLVDGTLIEATPDAGGFVVFRDGPVRTVMIQRGHFIGPNGSTLCDATSPAYEPLGYTLSLAFTRGNSHVDVGFNIRNECSDLFSGPWNDDATTLQRVSYVVPLSLGATSTTHYQTANGGLQSPASGDVVVAQRRGGGTPWSRRAHALVGGTEVDTGVTWDAPMVAVQGPLGRASAHMPWTRFREPQGLAVTGGTTLSLDFVSESLVIGEARGIWNLAQVRFSGATTFDQAAADTASTAAMAALERGLLIRTSLATLNAAAVFPHLGNDAPSTLRDTYLSTLEGIHADTLDVQWEASKTYGSQLWPDIVFSSAPVDTPALNGPVMNYWNGSRTELLEYLRAGDVKWVWDWALPQSWYQFFSAYANAGEATHGNRNGAALTSGGCGWQNGCCHWPPPAPAGCDTSGDDHGHWNRTNQGSDDYTYTHGDIAYVVRPTFALQRRFAQAGSNIAGRYVDDPSARELFVSERNITRQVIQHFALLANCAEFVPGAEGQACHDKLQNIFEELAVDNLSAGVLCQRDDPATGYAWGSFALEAANPTTCGVPQQFMQNALMLPLFHRIHLNYGDIGGSLRRALWGAPWNFYVNGSALPIVDRPQVADAARPAIRVEDAAPWTNVLQYTLTSARTDVASCNPAPVNQPVTYDDISPGPMTCCIDPSTTDLPADFAEDLVLFPNRPHSVGWLAVAHNLEPSIRACALSAAALNDAAFLDFWNDYVSPGQGWAKGPAQMMNGVVFAIGALDTCVDPPACMCPDGQTCDGTGACVPCSASQCGGGCGDCAGANEVCVAGQCVVCNPDCDAKVCGSDGCGGTCGTCSPNTSCSAQGQCVPDPVEGSCLSLCGSDQISGDCYCDAVCFENDDCCPDICTVCSDSFGPPECP